MQSAQSTPVAPQFIFAMRLRGEKPHQGVRSSNPAPYRVRNRCNLRSALGLRAGCVGNRVRSFCSGEQYDSDLNLYYLRARYMNPVTGRFMSRDPEDGDPTDPATLQKYLYANGDPTNRMDPSGRTTMTAPAPTTSPSRSASEYATIVLNIAIRAIPPLAALGCTIKAVYAYEALRTPSSSSAAVKLDLPHCSATKDCTPYEEAIQAALDEVIGRYNELLADIHGLYPLSCKNPNASKPGIGSWAGHLQRFDDAKLDLQNAIADAIAAGCPVPPEAEEWATKSPPSCPE